MVTPTAQPFLKWAGGKRKLAPEILKLFPPAKEIRRYYEPFLGGGALFFSLRPWRATLTDANRELVTTWQAVQRFPHQVCEALRLMRNTEEEYYRIRAQDPVDMKSWDVAARMIYLNKTGFNGLYRVNQKGKFNNPFGRYKNPKICDAFNLFRVHEILQGVTIREADFEDTVKDATHEDAVYFDPPYVPLSSTANFTQYTASGFGPDDHRRLRDTAKALKKRGVRVVLSNADTPEVRELYADFQQVQVQAPRAIASKVGSRAPVSELLMF